MRQKKRGLHELPYTDIGTIRLATSVPFTYRQFLETDPPVLSDPRSACLTVVSRLWPTTPTLRAALSPTWRTRAPPSTPIPPRAATVPTRARAPTQAPPPSTRPVPPPTPPPGDRDLLSLASYLFIYFLLLLSSQDGYDPEWNIVLLVSTNNKCFSIAINYCIHYSFDFN